MKDKVKRILQMIGVFAVVGVCAVILPKEAANAATVYEAEDNGSYATANFISMGDEMVGQIADYNDCDYYKVTPGKSGALTISFKHTYEDSYDGWDVSLVHETDGNYETLTEWTVKLCDNEKLTFPFIGTEKDHNYYVVVRNYSHTSAQYKITATFAASDKIETEANNAYATANTIKLGETYKGVINNRDDKDYYKIVAPENGKIDISFKHTYADSYAGWTISLVHYSDGSYEELSSCNVELSDNEKIALPYIGVKKGDIYYVVVKEGYYRHTDAEYKFTTSFKKSNLIEKENNNSYATATKVELNKTYSGIINQSGDKDYYKLEIPTPGTLSIKFVVFVDASVADEESAVDVAPVEPEPLGCAALPPAAPLPEPPALAPPFSVPPAPVPASLLPSPLVPEPFVSEPLLSVFPPFVPELSVPVLLLSLFPLSLPPLLSESSDEPITLKVILLSSAYSSAVDPR